MKVVLNYTKDFHFKASARNFKDLNVDEPDSFHGTNLGPSAVEYLLIGIGGCLGTTFIYCLQKRKIELESFEVEVDGKLTHTGPKMHLKLANVTVDLTYRAKEETSAAGIEECVNVFKEFCIVTNSIANGIPIDVNCVKK